MERTTQMANYEGLSANQTGVLARMVSCLNNVSYWEGRIAEYKAAKRNCYKEDAETNLKGWKRITNEHIPVVENTVPSWRARMNPAFLATEVG